MSTRDGSVTSQFVSTSRLASRRRTRVVVERATFVVVMLGADRVALPVELVERIVRPSRDALTVSFQGQILPVLDIATPLHRVLGQGDAALRRVVVLRDDTAATPHHERAPWCAVPVDAVLEVCAVETALIAPLASDAPDAMHRCARATFERQAMPVLVIDPRTLLMDRHSA